MAKRPGHNSGQAEAPATFTWDEYVAGLVEEHGSLAAVALKLVELRGFVEDAESVERGLRRLRSRGQREGGDSGRRLLAAFGMPREVESRVRWMGMYHSRFTDLPSSLCRDQLRLWDRPPVSESRARIWIQLGLATLVLRGRDLEAAEIHVRQARGVAAHASPAARVELALLEAYCASRHRERSRVLSLLDEAGALLESVDVGEDDRACLHARWMDQRAFQLNNPGAGQQPDLRSAMALYECIPSDAPPFARCRRENGLAYGHWQLGEREAAIAHAEAASRAAGDGGSLRLRVMALKMLSRIQGGEEGERTRQRAEAIARLLEDEELLFRTRPLKHSGPPGRTPSH
jgi:hypothetical protein